MSQASASSGDSSLQPLAGGYHSRTRRWRKGTQIENVISLPRTLPSLSSKCHQRFAGGKYLQNIGCTSAIRKSGIASWVDDISSDSTRAAARACGRYLTECEFDPYRSRRDLLRPHQAWAISIWRETKERSRSATQGAEHETWSASSFGALEYLSYTPCIGAVATAFNRESRIVVEFSLNFRFGKFRLAITQNSPTIPRKLHPEKRRSRPATGRLLL